MMRENSSTIPGAGTATGGSCFQKKGHQLVNLHRIALSKNGLLLFGGSDVEGKSLSDTWVFKEDSWQQINSRSFSTGPKAAYINVRREKRKSSFIRRFWIELRAKKVIYGDTWEFDGSDWMLMNNNPAIARDHPCNCL